MYAVDAAALICEREGPWALALRQWAGRNLPVRRVHPTQVSHARPSYAVPCNDFCRPTSLILCLMTTNLVLGLFGAVSALHLHGSGTDHPAAPVGKLPAPRLPSSRISANATEPETSAHPGLMLSFGCEFEEGRRQGGSFRFTEHHLPFALLHLLVLGLFLYRASHAPKFLRGLVGAVEAFAIAGHALLGGLCESPTIAAALPAFAASSPLNRIGLLHQVVDPLVACAVAAYFVRCKSEGPGCAAKIVVQIMMATVHILVLGWWIHAVTEYTVRALLLSTDVLLNASLALIYLATKSCTLALVLIMSPAVMITTVALNASFPVDPEGRLLCNLDLNGSSRQNPLHWSMIMRRVIPALSKISVHAAIASTVTMQPHSTAVSLIPTSADVSTTKPRTEWLLLSVLTAAAAMDFHAGFMNQPQQATVFPNKQVMAIDELLQSCAEKEWAHDAMMYLINAGCHHSVNDATHSANPVHVAIPAHMSD